MIFRWPLTLVLCSYILWKPTQWAQIHLFHGYFTLAANIVKTL